MDMSDIICDDLVIYDDNNYKCERFGYSFDKWRDKCEKCKFNPDCKEWGEDEK